MSKKQLILAVSLAACTTCSFGANSNDNFDDNGLYISAQIGTGTPYLNILEYGFTTALNDKSVGVKNINGSFAGRIGLGIQLNRYFSIEGGVSRYPSAYRYDNSTLPFTINTHAKFEDIYAADILAGLRLPIKNRLYLKLEAGCAAVHINLSSIYNDKNQVIKNSWKPESKVFFSPKASFSVGAKINQKLSLFAKFSYILDSMDIDNFLNPTNPQKRDYQPGLSMTTVGLNYTF